MSNQTNVDCSSDEKINISKDITKSSNVTKQFHCTMNPNVQLDKIINDANQPNFLVEANNSGFNVNIRCNSGTYAKVARPTILSFDHGFSATSINLFCTFTPKSSGVDKNQLEFNKIITACSKSCSNPTEVVATALSP